MGGHVHPCLSVAKPLITARIILIFLWMNEHINGNSQINKIDKKNHKMTRETISFRRNLGGQTAFKWQGDDYNI